MTRVVDKQLFTFAYRMLGVAADAEDVVQQARLKVIQMGDVPREPERYLFRTAANLCIDRLREEKRRRETYVGPWLPEPVPTEALAERADDLSVGFLLLLERLSPSERLVFVLRTAYELSFADISDIANASESACRQRFKRARENVKSAKRYATPASVQRRLIERFIALMQADDLDGVVALLKSDAEVLTDGGGVVSAAIRPITGRARIAQVSMFLMKKTASEGPVEYVHVDVNGGMGLLVREHGKPHSLIVVDGTENAVESVYVLRNPMKLGRFL